MNNLAEVCLTGLGVVENLVRCLIISMGLGGEKRCCGDFKVIILREAREEGSHQRVDTSIFHEGCSHCVILLF